MNIHSHASVTIANLDTLQRFKPKYLMLLCLQNIVELACATKDEILYY